MVPVCVWRLGRAASEPRRPLQKRKTPLRVSFFLEQHFCSAKVLDSKEQITVIFKGGLKSVQPLTK